MDIVQVTRRIVDQQVRPAQRGGTTADGVTRHGTGGLLMRVDASGVVVEYGTYGRAVYGRRRYAAGQRG